MNSEISPLPTLFTPLTLRGVTLPNRVVVSPMCQYNSEDGSPLDFHLVHLGQYALGGAGLIMTEETSVEAEGRKTHHCAGLYKHEHVLAYRRINAFIHEQGALTGIQLGHAGRKASGRSPWDGYRSLNEADEEAGLRPWPTIAPSSEAHSADSAIPHALTLEGIQDVLDRWRQAAVYALEADYDVLEIHTAHGYLLHQFLSPWANKRRDAYGGDLEGRMRLCLEVIETVRKVWPADKPLFLRLSAMDGDTDGWSFNDTLELSKAAHDRGVDVITPSSGGIKGPTASSVVPRLPGYHVNYAEKIKKETGIATLAVGLITEPEHAESILLNSQADLIGLARELLWNPYWTVHAAKKLGMDSYFDLLPQRYSWWLKRRETIQEMARTAAPI